MTMLYDKLYLSAGFTEIAASDYLPDLVDEIIGNFPNAQNVAVEKNIDDFIINAKYLQPLGIIINELLTNTMKYAFVNKGNGFISVSAKNTGRHVAITIQDDGNGIPESIPFENSTGFGLQLVQALTQQLQGSIRMERGNGTKFILEFEI